MAALAGRAMRIFPLGQRERRPPQRGSCLLGRSGLGRHTPGLPRACLAPREGVACRAWQGTTGSPRMTLPFAPCLSPLPSGHLERVQTRPPRAQGGRRGAGRCGRSAEVTLGSSRDPGSGLRPTPRGLRAAPLFGTIQSSPLWRPLTLSPHLRWNTLKYENEIAIYRELRHSAPPPHTRRTPRTGCAWPAVDVIPRHGPPPPETRFGP